MKKQAISVLLIEDNPGDARLTRDLLTQSKSMDIKFIWADRLSAGIERLHAENIDVVLLDLGLPESVGLDTVQRLLAQAPNVPVVVMSGLADEAVAIKALQAGVQDYLIKGQIDGALLERALRYAIERNQAKGALRQAHTELERRVQERTTELASAVEAMRAEMAERRRAEETLRVREERFGYMALATHDAIYDWNIHSGSVWRNEAYQMLYAPDEPVGTDETWWENRIHIDDRARVLEAIKRAFREHASSWSDEYRFQRHDGVYAHIVDRGYIMYDKAGAPLRMIGAMTDITERKQAEQALRERDARIRRLVDSNIIGIFFFELGGYISDANDAFLGIVGYTRDDMLTQKLSWATITPPEYVQADKRAIDEALRSGGCTPYEKEYIRKDGQRVPVLMGGALLEGSQDQAIGFVLDLTERKRAEERIRHMAHHDALTGLPNRLLFHDRVDQAIAQSHRNNTQVAVLFIDLDHFKDVNDSLGHLAGDHLLRATARRLQGCLREGDSVARLGGDEFVIGLPALTDSSDAILIASKILAGLRQPFELDQHELHVSGSIGISIYPADGEDAEALMRTADTAMYHAKERGRDNYQFFTQQLNDAAQRRLTIANRMHRALEHGEFTLHYQPQLDLKRERISSVEALIRWHQPAGDLAACSEFIKIAEDTGLIVPLGEWVLREACAQLRRWREAGYPELRIAVNLSPHQFRRPGFADLVAGILEESGLAGTALEMEITEGVLMIQSPENLKILEQLTDMGVGLAVDDFGTGYSSLSYLQRFPIQTLKIDQSFVDGIGEDPNDTAIVRAIIAMADSLRLRVVAEGVETAGQESFLKTHGCFMAQGFYYSPAVSAAEFSELLRDQATLASGANERVRS